MRPRTAAAVTLAGLLVAFAGGCGKKAGPAGPGEVASTDDPPAPRPPAERPADPAGPSGPAGGYPGAEGPNPGGFPRGPVSPFRPMDPGGPMPPAAGNPFPPAPPPANPTGPLGGLSGYAPPAGSPLPPAPTPGAGQPPVGPPAPKDPAPGQPPKDPPLVPPGKEPPKPKEPDWPERVNGKGLGEYLKELTDPDPFIRDMALRTIPSFGPVSRKGTGKMILARMSVQTEKDPMVRAAAYTCAATIGFEDDNDMKEAVRLLGVTANEGQSGGMARLHAVEALMAFGTKADGAVHLLIGPPINDLSYKTRQMVARCLGRIAMSEETGPNNKALTCLSANMSHDPSAAVRLEAVQSLVNLGPPWLPREPAPPGGTRPPPKTDDKAAAVHITNLKRRLAPAGKSGNLVEKDKQVEINVRLALMRFDPKEINDENLGALAKYITSPEPGVRLQALGALGMLGDLAERQLDAVVAALTPDDMLTTDAALNTLAAMGVSGKPAVSEIEKLEKGLAKVREDRVNSAEFKKLVAGLKPEELQQVIESLPEEVLRKKTVAVIKYLKEVKPGPPPPADPPKK